MPPAARCVFCEIVAGTRRAHVVLETPTVLAFMDQYRQGTTPAHVLVIPRAHVENIYGVNDALGADLFAAHARVARGVKRAFAPPGITTWSSNEAGAGQEVMHFHLHVFPGKARVGLLLADLRGRLFGRGLVTDEALASAAARIRAALDEPGP